MMIEEQLERMAFKIADLEARIGRLQNDLESEVHRLHTDLDDAASRLRADIDSVRWEATR